MSPSRLTAQVYIQLKTRALDKPFDYLVPSRLLAEAGVGAVVLVSFGSQKVLGIIAGLAASSAEPAAYKLVEIEAVLPFPPIPEPLIQLALWVADYYYCSPATALGLVLPPGGLPALVRQKSDAGIAYRLKAPAVKAKEVQFVRLAAAALTDEVALTGAQTKLVSRIKPGEELPVAELCSRSGVSRSMVKTLARRGVLELYTQEVRRSMLRYYGGSAQENEERPHRLNQAQAAAVGAIVERLEAADPLQRSRPVLLQGVPGAGKTEVYLQAIGVAVSGGGAAIVLVPEISLTGQAVRRFRRRFGARVGVLHSGLTPGERYDEYLRCRRGEVSVLIGPRSALFAPLAHLRLIVIDEENDGSFKQENDPRYDARRVALERARREGVSLVYGSATPSLESYRLVRDRFVLPQRATGAALPQVEIVDMRQEQSQLFSSRLLAELDSNLLAGGKSILLLNRRGYARFMQCNQCGHVWECQNCEVSLTLHATAGRLLCHHCGYGEALPDLCPVCRSVELRRWGIGTERLEREVKARFPEAAVFRLDADTARSYGEAPRILEEFGRAPKAILLGTQMVAKGHHFPEVTLAAVLNADLALQFPEFRAEEQTFAILLQLAGRSGRAQRPGKVIIQTWNAGIECIKMAASQSVEEFYQAELERRRRLGYPPFSSLVNIICLSRESDKPARAADFIKQKLAPVTTVEKILGPAELFRLKGWSRSHILVKTDSIERSLAAFKPVLERYRGRFAERGVRLVVDVDPQWLS